MHTLGHPADSSNAAMTSTSHTSVAAMDALGDAHQHTDTPMKSEKLRAEMPAHSPTTHPPLMAMDMLSLCMAVMVGAWALAALVRSALTRHPHWLADRIARVPALSRPNPPPRGPDLTRLSVLRL